MTPAEDDSKLNTLIAKLVKFKNFWDRDAPLPEVFDRFRRLSLTLRGVHAAASGNDMHAFYRSANVKVLQRLCCFFCSQE